MHRNASVKPCASSLKFQPLVAEAKSNNLFYVVICDSVRFTLFDLFLTTVPYYN